MTIIPSSKLLKILDPKTYTSRRGVSKPFHKQLPSVRGRVFEALDFIFQQVLLDHFIRRTKRPEREYVHISQKQLRGIFKRDWDCIRDFLKSNDVIRPYINKEEKESYSTGTDKEGDPTGTDPFPKSWRFNPKYLSTDYFDFIPITDKPVDSVTLHPSIHEDFREIVKLRGWNRAIEFIMAHQIHLFDYTPITKVTESKYGRQFNKVNCLAREIREFVLIDGIETETIDYSSCSLAILYGIVSRINGEQSRWLEMLNHPNGAYQYIADAIGSTRDSIKKDAVRWLGCNGKDQHWGAFNMNRFMENNFPITHADIQSGSINLVEHTQRIESQIIVHALDDKGISIHDAILVKEHDVDEVTDLLEKIMGHFTSGRNVEDFDEFDLMFSDNHKLGVSGKPKVEPKVIRAAVRDEEINNHEEPESDVENKDCSTDSSLEILTLTHGWIPDNETLIDTLCNHHYCQTKTLAQNPEALMTSLWLIGNLIRDCNEIDYVSQSLDDDPQPIERSKPEPLYLTDDMGAYEVGVSVYQYRVAKKALVDLDFIKVVRPKFQKDDQKKFVPVGNITSTYTPTPKLLKHTFRKITEPYIVRVPYSTPAA